MSNKMMDNVTGGEFFSHFSWEIDSDMLQEHLFNECIINVNMYQLLQVC